MPHYLYNYPFVDDRSKLDPDLIYSYISLEDRREEARLHSIVLQFALDERAIDYDNDNKRFLSSIVDNVGSWQYAVNWLNIRSLVDKTQHTQMMSSLQSDDLAFNKILNLHVRLGAFFDPILLNTIITRLITSLQVIPYKVQNNENLISWEYIHKTTPFLWVIALMQSLIHNEVRSPEKR